MLPFSLSTLFFLRVAMSKNILVIGAGFSGLAAATTLASEGFQVTLLEKHPSAGGRARHMQQQGFLFDMGPSWYWMPDVFEQYFGRFGKKPSDYYTLKRLDPSYAVVFGEQERLHIPASMDKLRALFEELEPGSAQQLDKFLAQAAYKYEVGMNDLVHKPSLSVTEFLDPQLLIDVMRMDVFTSMHRHVGKFFKNDKLVRLLEFPVLFLGAVAEQTPALYSLMNYADMCLGTWYPMGGMCKIVEGMERLAVEQGVQFRYGQEVQEVIVENGVAKGVRTQEGTFWADAVVAGADYHHVESKLLPPQYRSYTEDYWQKRTMAPSSLIFYLGVSKRIKGLLHHNLFFDEDLREHAREIYTAPKWPSKPLFYVCAPSVTDPSVAPEGCENLFILMPTAPGLQDDEATREHYFSLIMERLERITGEDIRPHIAYKQSYAHRDFISDYNAFKGNAYGLANTLMQTAILKPSIQSRKVENLFYTGQLTAPGPGVPPSLISGQVVAGQVAKCLQP